MSDNLPVLDNSVYQFEGKRVRLFMIEGQPWFAAKDSCKVLELSNSRVAISVLDENEKGVREVYTLGGEQIISIISESGLYKLIMRSNKPEAKRFQNWLTSVVLPSIRKTGSYSVNQQFQLPSNYLEALEALVGEVKKNLALEAENKAMLPKADFYDTVAASGDAISIGEAAKIIFDRTGMGRNTLFSFLRGQKILMKNNNPYQAYLNSGYFKVIEQPYITPDKQAHVSLKTLVYQKGVDFILRQVEDSLKQDAIIDEMEQPVNLDETRM